jgi:hypothetical protein
MWISKKGEMVPKVRDGDPAGAAGGWSGEESWRWRAPRVSQRRSKHMTVTWCCGHYTLSLSL